MAARMDPYALVGTTIGQRYSVDFFVGVGRFSVVYRGTQIDTLRPVALKFLKVRRDLERSSRTVVMQRLHDAKATLGDIAQHCPTFCEILDTSALVTADGRWVPFVVQSWLDGTPLESELVNDALHGQRWRTLTEAIDLLAPVADALAYAHARGVIHGGLAPRSLYLQNESMEWRVTDVLDLGVADVLSGAQKDARSFVEEDAPLLCFAPAYGAPEQFSNLHGDVGPATDVYALALIVVELLVGRSPLGDGDDELLEAVSTDPSERPTPATLGLDVGRYVEAVLARALAVDPDQRYATITAFWDALRAAHRMTLLPSASAPSSVRARQPRPARVALGPGGRPRVRARAGDPSAVARARPRSGARAGPDDAAPSRLPRVDAAAAADGAHAAAADAERSHARPAVDRAAGAGEGRARRGGARDRAHVRGLRARRGVRRRRRGGPRRDVLHRGA